MKFTKERDLVLNQVCEIWSKRLKQEHDGNIPSDFVVELKDIKDFVKNALKGLNEDADGGGGAGGGGDDDDDDAEVDNEVEVKVDTELAMAILESFTAGWHRNVDSCKS